MKASDFLDEGLESSEGRPARALSAADFLDSDLPATPAAAAPAAAPAPSFLQKLRDAAITVATGGAEQPTGARPGWLPNRSPLSRNKSVFDDVPPEPAAPSEVTPLQIEGLPDAPTVIGRNWTTIARPIPGRTYSPGAEATAPRGISPLGDQLLTPGRIYRGTLEGVARGALGNAGEMVSGAAQLFGADPNNLAQRVANQIVGTPAGEAKSGVETGRILAGSLAAMGFPTGPIGTLTRAAGASDFVAGGLPTFFAPAAGRKRAELEQAGLPPLEATLGGIGAGAAEYLTELPALKALDKVITLARATPLRHMEADQLGKFFLANLGVQGWETSTELASDVGNWLVDRVTSDPSATPKRLLSDMKQTLSTMTDAAPFLAALGPALGMAQRGAVRAAERLDPKGALGFEFKQTGDLLKALTPGQPQTPPALPDRGPATDLLEALRGRSSLPPVQPAAPSEAPGPTVRSILNAGWTQTGQPAEAPIVPGQGRVPPYQPTNIQAFDEQSLMPQEGDQPLWGVPPNPAVGGLPGIPRGAVATMAPPVELQPDLEGGVSFVHDYALEGAPGRLARTLNRDRDMGGVRNRRTALRDAEGGIVVGRLTKSDWLRRAQTMLSEPGEFRRARKWYQQLHDTLAPIYGDEAPRVALAWLMSQQNESPSGGMRNVLRAIDEIRGKTGMPKAGLNAAALRSALLGQVPKGGLASKLLDFMDSEMGLKTRTVMGRDPRGGQPAAFDIWAMRDQGRVDKAMYNRLKQRFGEQALIDAGIEIEPGKPTEAAYEHGVRWYNELAKWLNENKVDGGGWTAREVQAVGWTAIQKAVGAVPEYVEDIIGKNTRIVSLGLLPGKGSGLGADHPIFEPGRAEQVVRDVAEKAGVKVLKVERTPGAFLGDREPSLAISAFASPEAVRDFIEMLGYVFRQSSVIATRPLVSGKQGAIEVTLQKGADTDAFFEALRNATAQSNKDFGLTPGYQAFVADGYPVVRLLKFGGHFSKREMAQIELALGLASGQTDIEVLDSTSYNVNLEEAANDWRKQKTGAGYKDSLRNRGRLSEAQWLDDYGRRVWAESEGLRAGEEGAAEPGRWGYPPPAALSAEEKDNLGTPAGAVASRRVAPKKTVTAYKLFRTLKSRPGELFPLFMDKTTPIPIGVWLDAKVGSGKIGSRPLAVRPGWHAGDRPSAPHLMKKDGTYGDRVWAEVELPADVDWQAKANKRARRRPDGTIIESTAEIKDEVPVGGHYRYKTNPRMQGEWLIAGAMKVNRILSEEEVGQINSGLPAGAVGARRVRDPGARLARNWQSGRPGQQLRTERPVQNIESTPEFAAAKASAERIFADYESAKRAYEALDESDGGRVMNPDIASELVPEYVANRELASAVHDPASDFVKRYYKERLAGDVAAGKLPNVLFSAGGPGSGKSTAMRRVVGELAKQNDIYYDSSLSRLESAVTRIEQALDSGRGVDIVFIDRSPINAYEGGVLQRVFGGYRRIVPADEHTRSHVEARKVIRQLARKYANDPRVTITAIDNNGRQEDAKPIKVDDVANWEYNDVKQQILDLLGRVHAEGKISDLQFAAATYSYSTGADQAAAQAQRSDDAEGAAGERAQGVEGRAYSRSTKPGPQWGKPPAPERAEEDFGTDNEAAAEGGAMFGEWAARPKKGESREQHIARLRSEFETRRARMREDYRKKGEIEQQINAMLYEDAEGNPEPLIRQAENLQRQVDAELGVVSALREALSDLGAEIPSGSVETRATTPQRKLFPGGSTRVRLSWEDLGVRTASDVELGIQEADAKRGDKSSSLGATTTPEARPLNENEQALVAKAASYLVNRGMPLDAFQTLSGIGVWEQHDGWDGVYFIGQSAMFVSPRLFRQSFAGTNINTDAGRANVIAHELAHHIDAYGGGNELKPSAFTSFNSERLDPEGDLYGELVDFGQHDPFIRQLLSYPMDLLMAGRMDWAHAKIELFPQMTSAWMLRPDVVRKIMPKWAEVMEAVYGSPQKGIMGPVTVAEANRRLREALQVGSAGRGGEVGRSVRQDSPAREPDRAVYQRGPPQPGVGGQPPGGGSNAGGAAANAAGQPGGGWAVSQPNLRDNLLRQWQDNRIDLKAVQTAIEQSLGVSPENRDARLAETLYKGRLAARVRRGREQLIDPLLRKIRDSGLTVDEVGEYLWARHAPERNRQMAKINPGGPVNLSGMFDNARQATLSGQAGARDAQTVLASFQSRGKMGVLSEIGTMVDRLTAARRRLLVAEGLEDQDVIDAWERAYKHYVPLMRDVDEPVAGSGFKVTGPESKRAMGSTAEAKHILAALIAQYENTLTRAERARVGRSLIKLAEAAPDPGFWKLDSVPRKKQINPSTGLVTVSADPMYRQRDDVYVVKYRDPATGGVRERVLSFNPRNERAMRLAKAMNNLDVVQLDGVTKVVGKVTRIMASLATVWNPTFWMTNAVRDASTASINLQSTPLHGRAPQILARAPLAIAGILDAEMGKGNSQWARHYRAFEAAGGKTGWLSLFEDLKARNDEIAAEIKRSQRSNVNPMKWGRVAIEYIEKANNAIENGVRLSAFVEGVRKGLSPAQAARVAKELTVDFNRKGNASTAMNAWYMFFNANVQGTARMIGGLAKSRKAQAMVGLMVAFAFARELVNRMIGDDDRDEETGGNLYELIPNHLRQRNMIFMIPGSGGKYVSIPLPYGFNVFDNAGRLMAEAVLRGSDLVDDKRKPGEMAWEFIEVLFDAFVPLGQSTTPLQMAAPSIADPAVQYFENKTWYGAPLRPEPFPGEKKPNHQLYFRGTSETAKDISRWLSDVTGGDDVTGGGIDISPTTLVHIFGTATGGVGRTGLGILDFSSNIVDRINGIEGDPVPMQNVPFVGKFAGEVTDRERYNRYQGLRRETQDLYNTVRKYRKLGDNEKADELIEQNPAQWAFAEEANRKDFRRDMTILNKEYKGAQSLPRAEREQIKKDLRAQEVEVVSRALRAYSEAARGDR